MKKTAVVAGLFLALTLGISFAQTGNSVNVTLPYSANVGSNLLPAGDYTVREIVQKGNSSVLEFSSRNTGVAFNVIAVQIPADSDGSDRSQLILKSDGERFNVDKLYVGSHTYGFQLVPAGR